MSNGFIYVVDAHFIDKINNNKIILDPSACACGVGLHSSSICTFATLVSVQTSIFTTDRDLSQDVFQPSKYSFTFLAYANFTTFY
jgi:hypothetical protein